MTPDPVLPVDALCVEIVTTAGETAEATAVQSVASEEAGTVATVPLLRLVGVETRSMAGRA